MKLTSIAANRTVLSYPNGSEVFFSYSTPVAGYSPSNGYFKTDQWYSSTTTRHINKWLEGITEVTEVPQEYITELVG